MTDRLGISTSVSGRTWCAANRVAHGGRLSRESTRSNCGVLVIRRVLPHSDSASGILAGMATRRKPKNPGGRPAVWGPRHTMSIRPPEGLYSKLEDAAEAAGLTVAEYCVVELAASHDFELPNTNSDQLPLAIGA